MFQSRNVSEKYPSYKRDDSNWIETFRERCRKRIKERRDQRFNTSRNLPSKEELKSFVLDAIQDEWKEFKTSSECEASGQFPLRELVSRSFASSSACSEIDEDRLLKELEEELLIQEESEFQEYLALYQLTEVEYDEYLEGLQEDNVLCPICCRNNLAITPNGDGSNQLSCSGDCVFTKNVPYELEEVRKRIDQAVVEHSTCPNLPGFTFTSTQDDSDLFLICTECSNLYHVL
ncbi:hypothetical protein J437_LFUL002646 [Ladona fulva]|uniref:RPA-interacting protein C-terminal domain-containing protein n=1 Tax=Ladona fulva TaxID=123851 RepID=A0A8K0JX03_LADFU|nr:hypothetical protein J437_LFUL002646 [Ladona fulva]